VSPTRRTALWVLGILLAGAALRLAIWWVSPPVNAFDDHLEPIALYATQWSRPAPDACWQCYQPPLYYALSAGVLRLSHLLTGDFWTAWRSVQLLSIVFSLLQLAIAWRLLTLVGARGLAPRLCALAVLALLPRDIYTAVFVSNDAALGLAVSLAVLLYLEAMQRGCEGRWALRLAALFAAACGAAWTKQSGLIAAILPVAFAIWWECQCSRRTPEGGVDRGRLVRVFAWLALGLAIVGADGRMGRFTRELLGAPRARARGLELACEVRRGDDLHRLLSAAHVDVGVDFTQAGLGLKHGLAMLGAGVHPLIGTSGVDEEATRRLDERARELGLGGLVVPNFSIGIWLQQRLALQVLRHFHAVEILEEHHASKRDAPSGTAVDTAERLAAAGHAGRQRAVPRAVLVPGPARPS